MITLIAPSALRNHSPEQEVIINKAHRTHLTTRIGLILASACCMGIATSNLVQAQSMNMHPHMNAGIVAIQQTLQAPGEQWVECPLESLFETISMEFKLPIWCDRRVPRDTVVRLEPKTETLESLLLRALDTSHATLIPLDGVLMIAPTMDRDRIESAYWKLVVSRAAQPLLRSDSKPFGWVEESMPSQIVDMFVQRYLKDVREWPEIEHDLWKAYEFRKASPAAIGTCLLSGFDLCLVEKQGNIQVGALPTSDSGEIESVPWTYPADTVKRFGENKDVLKAWQTKWPQVSNTKEKNGDRTIAAPATAHRELVRPLIPQKKWEPKPAAKAEFSGRLLGTLEGVLRGFGSRAKLVFAPMPLPAKIADKEIDVTVKNASVDEVLREIGMQANVEFRRVGTKVDILFP